MNQDRIQLKAELESDIAKYYNEPFMIAQIVENKIFKEMIDRNSVFNLLWESIQQQVGSLAVDNFMHYSFPNYVAVVDIPSSLNGNAIRKKRSFVICISLLVNYYTLYFSDSFWFNEYVDQSSPNGQIPPRFTVHSFESNSNAQEVNIDEINRLVTSFFPEKKYVSHDLLKKWRFKGYVPFGEDPGMANLTSFSAFELLFDRELTFGGEFLEILK